MSIQLQIEEMPGYLAAKFTGAGVMEEICRHFELIAEHCKRANKNKLLLDFMGASAADDSLGNRYFGAEKAGIFAFYNIKVAVAIRPELLDPQRFGETAIRNQWVNARVFISIEDADEWLLK